MDEDPARGLVLGIRSRTIIGDLSLLGPSGYFTTKGMSTVLKSIQSTQCEQ